MLFYVLRVHIIYQTEVAWFGSIRILSLFIFFSNIYFCIISIYNLYPHRRYKRYNFMKYPVIEPLKNIEHFLKVFLRIDNSLSRQFNLSLGKTTFIKFFVENPLPALAYVHDHGNKGFILESKMILKCIRMVS